MAHSQAKSRQVTVEVMEGNPLVLPIDPPQGVDITLLDKLFPNLHKRKSLSVSDKIVKTFGPKRSWSQAMTVTDEDRRAGRPPNKRSNTRPRMEHIEKVEVGKDSNLRDALNLLQDYNTDKLDDSLRKLQLEALRAQIEKDRIMSQYYAKKLELLNGNN